MRWLMILLCVLCLAAPAAAASYGVTWTQDAGVTADTTEVERAPVTQGHCGAFATVGSVAFGALTFTDSAAPTGTQCYRVRNLITIDPGDGGPAFQKASAYSNIDSTKPGNPKNLSVQ